MTTTRNNYLTILQFLMIMIRSHKKLSRQSTKAVSLMKNVLMRNVPWSTHTSMLTLQESWFLIKALRLFIQNTSCLTSLQRSYDVSTTQLQGPKIVSTLSYENIVQDVALMKHFTGLKPSQFDVLHDFLDDVYPLETINYWKSIQKDFPATENARTGPKADFHQEKNFSFVF